MIALLLALSIAVANPYQGLVRVPGEDKDQIPIYLEPEAAEAWQDLLEYAARSGVELRLNYGFRTPEQQLRLYRKNRQLAARPGESDHELGISVDIAGTRERRGRGWRKTALFYWLRHEAPRFGFVNDVPGESWHWTFLRQDATISLLQ